MSASCVEANLLTARNRLMAQSPLSNILGSIPTGSRSATTVNQVRIIPPFFVLGQFRQRGEPSLENVSVNWLQAIKRPHSECAAKVVWIILKEHVTSLFLEYPFTKL